jgi:rhodanese-related sulfurtransferase
VAQQLRDAGIAAAALVGGLNAWKAEYPVEQIDEVAATGLATA